MQSLRSGSGGHRGLITPKFSTRNNPKRAPRDLCLRIEAALQILAVMPDSHAMPAQTANPAPSRGPLSPLLVILGLLSAGLIVLAAISADSFVSSWVRMHAPPPLMDAAQFLSKSGEGQWPIGFGLIIMIIGWRWGRRDWRQAGLALVVATAVAGAVAITVRGTVGRSRPSNSIEQGWFGPYHDGKWSAFHHAYSSFPSGHAATAAGFAVTLSFVARRWGWVALIWMAGVGWSRICMEAHNFSDVIAGLLFGLVAALLILRSFAWPRFQGATTG